MTDQTQTSHPATIAPAWDVTATVTVTGAFAARYAHSGLSTALATIADEIDVSDIAVEAHRRDPATAGTYGETLAREIADELDRRPGQLLGWTITFRTDDGRVVLDDTDLLGTAPEAEALATSRDRDQFGDRPGRRGIAALHARPPIEPAPAASEETAGA